MPGTKGPCSLRERVPYPGGLLGAERRSGTPGRARSGARADQGWESASPWHPAAPWVAPGLEPGFPSGCLSRPWASSSHRHRRKHSQTQANAAMRCDRSRLSLKEQAHTTLTRTPGQGPAHGRGPSPLCPRKQLCIALPPVTAPLDPHGTVCGHTPTCLHTMLTTTRGPAHTHRGIAKGRPPTC